MENVSFIHHSEIYLEGNVLIGSMVKRVSTGGALFAGGVQIAQRFFSVFCGSHS